MYSSTQCRELRHWPSGPSSGAKTAPFRCRPQRRRLDGGRFQRGQWNESGRAGHGRDNEPVQAVEDGSREHFPEGTRVAGVSPAQRTQVSGAVTLVDDRRRIAEPDEDKVENQPACPPVAVQKRVDLLESAVNRGEGLREHGVSRVESVHPVDPACHFRGNERPRHRHHAIGKRMDLMFAEAPGCFARRCARM